MLTPEEISAIKKRLEAIALNINTPLEITLNQDDINIVIEEQNGIL